ncbi:MAG TPA: SlyX family protein [Azospirillaceae bacterium]|nr:SlyX family protein [Azospirillaceae bacterium]
MTDPVERRLVELESRVAHYERMAEDLSSVVVAQGKAIDLLTRQLRRLTERFAEMESGWSPSPQDEKPPPHY